MINFRRLTPCLLLAFVLAALWSCESEDYETGDGELSHVRADFAMADTDGESAFYKAETDDGVKLTFSNPTPCKWASVADSTYRALVYYNNKVEDGKVHAVGFMQVLTVSPMSPDKLKTVATDPVICESVWLSKDATFLNLGLFLKMGTPEGEYTGHNVGMVRDSVVTAPSGQRTHFFTFYHAQNDVPEYYSSRLWMSIRLSGVAASDSILLRINTYEGMTERKLCVE